MKISATVTLKKEVLDPQGKVVCQTLKNILKMLDLKPFDLVRKGEKIYKELNIGKYENNADALLKIMIH